MAKKEIEIDKNLVLINSNCNYCNSDSFVYMFREVI